LKYEGTRGRAGERAGGVEERGGTKGGRKGGREWESHG